jgi:hypothetical protein
MQEEFLAGKGVGFHLRGLAVNPNTPALPEVATRATVKA